jgi:anti-sigma regulatory factor (Ser/Thr protein kinase)
MKEIALHILDIVQNSISAGATLVHIGIMENLKDDSLTVSINDNGQGMDKETASKVSDPFFTSRTTRKVGLGIPLLKHSAEQAGGKVTLISEPGRGTTITAVFRHSHIDRPPVGDTPGVVSLIAGANPHIDFTYRHSAGEDVYVFDSREIKEVLEDISIGEPRIISYMKEMIAENLNGFFLAGKE